MTRSALLLFVFLGTASTFLLTSCDLAEDSSSDRDRALYLRIHNDTDADTTASNVIYGPIHVVVRPATDNPNSDGFHETVDFGTLAVGEVSEYRQVPNMFTVEVDGEVFGEEDFGISSPPSDRWILEIQTKYAYGGGDFGYGWSQEIQ